MTKLLPGISIAALLLFVGGSAKGDWMVMRDGSRIETQGHWEEKGRLVVFTTTAGVLSSVRSSEVDLEESDRATEEAQSRALEEAQSPEPMPAVTVDRAPVLVLTDSDVGHVAEDAGEVEAAGGAAAASQSPLTVVSWDQEEAPDGQGIIVRGTLRNDGTVVATRIQILAQILDSEGQIVDTQTAQLTASNLGPSEILNFRAQFAEAAGFDTARFDISSRGFEAAARGPGVTGTNLSSGEAEP